MQICQSLDKATQDSQTSQIQHLHSLHDKEKTILMKRLEFQNKEELLNLGKKHKDKNELARIKRELQHKLIDEAVSERHRLKTLLDKRTMELTDKHNEVKKKLEEEKKSMFQQKRKEYEEKCDQLRSSYHLDGSLFVQNYLTSGKKD